MPETDLPPDLPTYLQGKLTGLHQSAQLVFVFDPSARLALPGTFNAGGRTWAVVPYDGNDVALREAWRASNPLALPRLVWATCRGRNELRLSSLVDLLVRADAWFDCSLAGVLTELAPQEAWWPIMGMLEQHADLLAANVSAAVDGHFQLRRLLGPDAALDAASVRLLALHAAQPAVPIADLLFQHDTPAQALLRFLRLLWETSWPTTAHDLLVEHVRSAAPGSQDQLAPWLAIPAEQLAVYLYARRFLGQHRVHAIVNQLRGLGFLAFDPEPLEEWIEAVLVRWDRAPIWRQKIVAVAESELSDDDLRRMVDILPRDVATEWATIRSVETPGLFVQLVLRLMASVPDSGLDKLMQSWPEYRPALLAALPSSQTGNAAAALADLLDNVAGVLAVLARGLPGSRSLDAMVDWYIEGGVYGLEFACARAADAARRLIRPTDRERLTVYVQNLRLRVREFIDRADQILAANIKTDYSGYLANDRLATKLIAGLLGQIGRASCRERVC